MIPIWVVVAGIGGARAGRPADVPVCLAARATARVRRQGVVRVDGRGIDVDSLLRREARSVERGRAYLTRACVCVSQVRAADREQGRARAAEVDRADQGQHPREAPLGGRRRATSGAPRRQVCREDRQLPARRTARTWRSCSARSTGPRAARGRARRVQPARLAAGAGRVRQRTRRRRRCRPSSAIEARVHARLSLSASPSSAPAPRRRTWCPRATR